MFRIRHGLFETNSSSTHTITVCSEKEYDDWKAGKLLYNIFCEKFIENYLLSDEALETKLKEYYESIKRSWFKDFQDLGEKELQDLRKDAVEKGYILLNLDDSDELYTYDRFWNRDSNLEGYVETYTSESGDKIIIFGEYGYDG